MYKFVKILLSAAIATSSAQVFAQNDPNLYAEIGYTSVYYKESCCTVNPTALRGVIGYNFQSNLSGELMLATGAESATIYYYSVPLTLTVNSLAGLYIKPKINLGDSAELFARIGYANIAGTASVVGYSFTGSGSGISFGGGMKFKFTDNSDINLDYMSYYNQNGTTVTGATIGYGYQFK